MLISCDDNAFVLPKSTFTKRNPFTGTIAGGSGQK